MAAISENTHSLALGTQPSRGGLWCHWASWPSRAHEKTQTGCVLDEEIYGLAFWAGAGSTSLICHSQVLHEQFYCITEYGLWIFLKPRPRGAEQAPHSTEMCRSLLLGGLFRGWLVDTRLCDLQLQDWCFVV